MDYIHSRIFYKLPLLVLLVLSAFFMPNQGRACMCMGKREAENILEYHPSVFIGVLTQIIQSDSLFSITMGSFMAQRYFNFKVLKSRKGWWFGEGTDYVSVFPDVGSSCAGGLEKVELGDTILLFANVSGNFLEVNHCTPYAILTKRKLENEYFKPNESDLKLIKDTTFWQYPIFNPEKSPKNVEAPPQYDWKYLALISSLIFNLFFLFRMIRLKKRD
jgi:hypothetical protein